MKCNKGNTETPNNRMYPGSRCCRSYIFKPFACSLSFLLHPLIYVSECAQEKKKRIKQGLCVSCSVGLCVWLQWSSHVIAHKDAFVHSDQQLHHNLFWPSTTLGLIRASIDVWGPMLILILGFQTLLRHTHVYRKANLMTKKCNWGLIFYTLTRNLFMKCICQPINQPCFSLKLKFERGK